MMAFRLIRVNESDIYRLHTWRRKHRWTNVRSFLGRFEDGESHFSFAGDFLFSNPTESLKRAFSAIHHWVDPVRPTEGSKKAPFFPHLGSFLRERLSLKSTRIKWGSLSIICITRRRLGKKRNCVLTYVSHGSQFEPKEGKRRSVFKNSSWWLILRSATIWRTERLIISSCWGRERASEWDWSFFLCTWNERVSSSESEAIRMSERREKERNWVSAQQRIFVTF